VRVTSLQYVLSPRAARVTAAKEAMNRLYVVENRFTLTGSMADHRLRCGEPNPGVTYAPPARLPDAMKDSGLSSLVGHWRPRRKRRQFDEQWITEAANDLVAKAGASLVLSGAHQPVVVATAGLCDEFPHLKNIGAHFCCASSRRNPNTKISCNWRRTLLREILRQLFRFRR